MDRWFWKSFRTFWAIRFLGAFEPWGIPLLRVDGGRVPLQQKLKDGGPELWPRDQLRDGF